MGGSRTSVAAAALAVAATGAVAALVLDGPGSEPPPRPAEAAQTVWTAGGERPLAREWAELSTADVCARTTSPGTASSRVQRVRAPAVQGEYAYRVRLRDGDRCYGERAEVGQANPTKDGFGDRLFRPGDERWIAWRIRLTPGFPTGTSRWQAVTQFKQLGGLGSPVLEFDVRRDAWELIAQPARPGGGSTRRWRLGRAVTGRWVEFVLHVRFSADRGAGFVELHGDLADGRGYRRLLRRRRTATLKVDPERGVVPSHARIGIYRDEAISGPAELHFDGFTVARTAQAARRGAR